MKISGRSPFSCQTNRARRLTAMKREHPPGSYWSRISEDFHLAYPEFRRFHQELELLVTRYGYLQTVFGRLRRFPNPAQSRNEWLAFPGQSTAVDVLIRNALMPLSKALPRLFGARSRILFSVHDSVITNVTVAEAGKLSTARIMDAYELVKSNMEAPIPELDGFSIPCEIKMGRSWGGGVKIETLIDELTLGGAVHA